MTNVLVKKRGRNKNYKIRNKNIIYSHIGACLVNGTHNTYFEGSLRSSIVYAYKALSIVPGTQ